MLRVTSLMDHIRPFYTFHRLSDIDPAGRNTKGSFNQQLRLDLDTPQQSMDMVCIFLGVIKKLTHRFNFSWNGLCSLKDLARDRLT